MSEESSRTDLTDIYSDGNIVKRLISPGTTPITKRDDVIVKILVTQSNSEVFKDDHLPLSLEPQFVPKGLIDLLSTMTLNEISEITVKADYFNLYFSEQVPQLQNLEDVKVELTVKEVMKIEDIYGDGVFYLRFMERNNEKPCGNSTRARVHYKLEINGYMYIDNTEQVPVQVMLTEDRVPMLWKEVLRRMREGEQTRIECDLTHEKIVLIDNGADQNLNISTHMPKDAKVAYLYLKVAAFDTGAFTEGLSTQQRSEISLKLKDEGNSYFKASELPKAIEYYQSALATLEPVADDPSLLKAHSATLLNNLTLCHLKLKAFTVAEEFATRILEINNMDVKALYRRGLARIGNNKLDGALEDLKSAKAIATESNDKDILPLIQKELAFINAEFKKANELEKSRFKNLFK